jgi:hypothetical protein
MAKQFRKLDQLMMSLGDKEASYDAGPGLWTFPSVYQLYEFGEAFVAWDDGIVTDEDTVHGTIWPTKSEIIRQDARFTYAEPRVRPTHLAGLAALAGGNLAASVQDGILTAYRHKIIPVAQIVQAPSIGLQEKASGEQYKYTGIKCDSFRLRRGGPDRAYYELEAGLIGSGTRGTASDGFVDKVNEAPLTWGKAQCWLETGVNISIDAAPTQGLENISGATPDNLTSRLLDFEFEWANDLQGDDGYLANSAKVRGRLDHGPRRGGRIRLVVIVDEATLATERGYYSNRDAVAIEIDVDSGVIIAETGAFKYGFDLIIPLLHLDPIARGVQDGFNVITFAGRCYDDGTNPLFQLYVYNAQATYLV